MRIRSGALEIRAILLFRLFSKGPTSPACVVSLLGFDTRNSTHLAHSSGTFDHFSCTVLPFLLHWIWQKCHPRDSFSPHLGSRSLVPSRAPQLDHQLFLSNFHPSFRLRSFEVPSAFPHLKLGIFKALRLLFLVSFVPQFTSCSLTHLRDIIPRTPLSVILSSNFQSFENLSGFFHAAWRGHKEYIIPSHQLIPSFKYPLKHLS